MLFILFLSLLGLTTGISAAITLPFNPPKETQSSPQDPLQTISTAANNLPTNSDINLSSSTNIDPRFTYEVKFTPRTLYKKSAYLNTLLALADLSTKGWTVRMKWETLYQFSGYSDVVIRIHASQHPSSLQYRYAIWGLYRAIHESSDHGFKECLLRLYWSPILGGTRHLLGYVSILEAPSKDIDSDNSTGNTLAPAEAVSPEEPPYANLTTTTTTTAENSTSSVTVAEIRIADNLRFEFNLENRLLNIDAVFRTIFSGLIYLSALDQSKKMLYPGHVTDEESSMYLRWDVSLWSIGPNFEPRFLISALSALPVYMYAQDKFREVRFIVFVSDVEAGRGWLYRQGLFEDSSREVRRRGLLE